MEVSNIETRNQRDNCRMGGLMRACGNGNSKGHALPQKERDTASSALNDAGECARLAAEVVPSGAVSRVMFKNRANA